MGIRVLKISKPLDFSTSDPVKTPSALSPASDQARGTTSEDFFGKKWGTKGLDVF